MAALKKYSDEDKRMARKVGFKSKCPKKPKRNASVAAMNSYIARHNDWVTRLKSKASEAKKKATLSKQIHKY